ncbi:hypothetical protein H2201_004625 [Coniosporium apollinis]|uniref:RING-type domain-containing protein n=1 Tax=Coniosporium apollinis TaxID=61459 RepID=A0ABQ9NXM2_9PEZI|nr:hypothetical protein H2201_004625 [Coniosporium apollinis]
MPPTRRNSTTKRPQRSISTSPGPAPSGSASKRQKTTHRRGSRASIKEPETIDLADGEPEDGRLKDVLEKQRIEAVAAQGLNAPKDGSGETQGISSICCVICMDNMTDMTATSCGHVFCHTCLLHALIAGENRAGPGETKRSQCPVCRKPLNRNKQADIIPLLLKKATLVVAQAPVIFVHPVFLPTTGVRMCRKRQGKDPLIQGLNAFLDIIKLIFAIFLPPLGVFLERGCNADFLINILLTVLGYIPGIIHALYIILKF